MARKKKNHSTKQDNVPADEALRREMIAQFIEENAEDDAVFQVLEAVPYEGGQFVRSTAGRRKKSD